MSVSIHPGLTALTRMLRLPTSRASDLVSPIRPAFAAAYAVWPALPCSPTTLVRFTMLPPRCFIIGRTAALERWNAEARSTSSTRRRSSAL